MIDTALVATPSVSEKAAMKAVFAGVVNVATKYPLKVIVTITEAVEDEDVTHASIHVVNAA